MVWLINYIDSKAKILKKFTWEGTLRQVIIRVYRTEIQSVMLVFRPSFVNYCLSNLLSGSISPPPPVWIIILYTLIQCVGGGLWGSGPQTDKHLPQSPFKKNHTWTRACEVWPALWVSNGGGGGADTPSSRSPPRLSLFPSPCLPGTDSKFTVPVDKGPVYEKENTDSLYRLIFLPHLILRACHILLFSFLFF